MVKVAILSQYWGQVYRGAEVFAQELSTRLPAKIYKNASAKLDPTTQVIISTNGRLDVYLAKAWCLAHHAKLIVSAQSGPGLDDRLNLYAFPDTFVALTGNQVAWAKKINPFVKTTIIPNGVDLAKFSPPISRKRSLTILNVAALEPGKRQELLIRAAAKIKNCSLILVGKGSKHDYLNSLGQQFLPSRFKILDYPHDHMPAIYQKATIFSYPTVPWESFGIVLLEAMAAGLPVVATNDPIRREIIGDAGILVDPQDTEQYSQALQKALSSNWGDKPRRQAEKFSWDSVAQKYDRLVRSYYR